MMSQGREPYVGGRGRNANVGRGGGIGGGDAEDKDNWPGHELPTLMTGTKNLTAEEHHNEMKERHRETGNYLDERAKEERKEGLETAKERAKEEYAKEMHEGGGGEDNREKAKGNKLGEKEESTERIQMGIEGIAEEQEKMKTNEMAGKTDYKVGEEESGNVFTNEEDAEERRKKMKERVEKEEEEEERLSRRRMKGERKTLHLEDEEKKKKERLKIDSTNPHSWLWAVETALEIEWPAKFAVAINGAVTAYTLSLLHPLSRSRLAEATIHDPSRLNYKFEGLPANSSFRGRVEARVGRHHWPYPLLDFVFTTPALLSSAEGAARKERGHQVSILSDLEVPGVAVTLRWSPAPFMIYVSAENGSSTTRRAHSSSSHLSSSTTTSTRSPASARTPTGYRLRVWHNAQIVQELFTSSRSKAKGCEITIGGLRLNIFYKVTIEATLDDRKSHEDEISPEGSPKFTPALSFNIDSGTLSVVGGGSTVDGVVECYSGLQVRCPRSERCVSPYWICDGAPDCPDGEDEQHCITTPCEGFRCWGDQCIPHAWRCDGEEDCMDGDDEYGCPVCSPEEFRCSGGGQCLPANATCDGVPHCQDGWDESAAVCGWSPGGQCEPDELQCDSSVTGEPSGRCVPSSWLCDGVEDCFLGEDEELSVCAALRAMHELGLSPNGTKKGGGTSTSGTSSNDEIREISKGVGERRNGCTNREFSCRTDECIPRRWLCDGRQDCWDGKDETSTACKLAAAEFIRERSVGIGRSDCADQEGYEYRCQAGRCIPRAWLCDEIKDCPTGDDEDATTCTSSSHSSSSLNATVICSGTDYKCLSGTCLPVEKLCDRSTDCKDGDDEHERCDYLLPTSTVTPQHIYHIAPPSAIAKSLSLSSTLSKDTLTSSAKNVTQLTTITRGDVNKTSVNKTSKDTSTDASDINFSGKQNYKMLPDASDHSVHSTTLSLEKKLVEDDEVYIDFDLQIEGSGEETTTFQSAPKGNKISMNYSGNSKANVQDRFSFNSTSSWSSNDSAVPTKSSGHIVSGDFKTLERLQSHTLDGEGKLSKHGEAFRTESFTQSRTSAGKNTTTVPEFDTRLTEHGTIKTDQTLQEKESTIHFPGSGIKAKIDTPLETENQMWMKAYHSNHTSRSGVKIQIPDGPFQTLPPPVTSSPEVQDKHPKPITEQYLINRISPVASTPPLTSQSPALLLSQPLNLQANLSSYPVPPSNLSDHKHYGKQGTPSHTIFSQSANSSKGSLHYVSLVKQDGLEYEAVKSKEDSILRVDNIPSKIPKVSQVQEGKDLVFSHEYEKAEKKENIEKDRIYNSRKKAYDGSQSSKQSDQMTEDLHKPYDMKKLSPESQPKRKETGVKFSGRPLIDDGFEINDNEEDLGFSARRRQKYPLESYSPGKENMGEKSGNAKDKVAETYFDKLSKPHSQTSNREIPTNLGKIPEDREHDIYSEGYDGIQKLPIDLDIPEIDDGYPFIAGKRQKIGSDRKWEGNVEFFRGNGEVYQEDDKVIAENEITFRETGDSTLTLEEDDDYVQTKHRRGSGDATATFYLEDAEHGQTAVALGSKGGRYYNRSGCRRHDSRLLAGLVLIVVFVIG